MNRFVVFLALVAAASAAPEMTNKMHFKNFLLYGAPIESAIADQALPTLLGWRSVYDRPVIIAVKEGNMGMSAFLIREGLAGLYRNADFRFLHELMLKNEMAGVMVSAGKFLGIPEMDLPVHKMILPKDMTLARYAELFREYGKIPIMMLIPKMELMELGGIHKLSLIGDFHVTEDSILITRDIPAPIAILKAAAADLNAATFYKYQNLQYPLLEPVPPKIFNLSPLNMPLTVAPTAEPILPLAYRHHPLLGYQRPILPIA